MTDTLPPGGAVTVIVVDREPPADTERYWRPAAIPGIVNRPSVAVTAGDPRAGDGSASPGIHAAPGNRARTQADDDPLARVPGPSLPRAHGGAAAGCRGTPGPARAEW